MMVTYFEETNIWTFWIDLYGNIIFSDFVSDEYFFSDKIRDK